ncbi:MAG: alkaline phosphatase family protein [Candidatus Tectomicrobia bacterium]
MKRSQTNIQPKVFIIGLDGATFDLIKPWAAAGKLPTFKHLLHIGVHASLESVIPPITPPAWTSFMTGMNPGKHGLFNFIEYNPQGHSIRYTNASNRKVHTLWRFLNDLGWTVGMINVPMTYPPAEVNGFCISGLDTPDADSNFVYPLWLKQELEQAVGEIYLDPRHLGYMKTDDKRDRVLKSLREIEKRRTDIAAYLIAHHPVDVMMLVYTATDTAQHFFWDFMDQTCPRRDAPNADLYRNAILDIYRLMDANIARLLKLLPEDCVVMVLSDHGGGPLPKTIVHLNQYLQELGLLVYKKGTRRASQRVLHRFSSALDGYLRGVLSPSQKARLSRMFPSLREQWESYGSSLTMIDWAQTQAYCLEVLAFPPAIWVNLDGQGPGGGVKAGAEYENLIAFLTERLYTLKDNATGKPFIRRVYHKKEIYQGSYMDLAPDLVLSWWEERAFQTRKSVPNATHPSVYQATDAATGRAASWSGTHRLHGILVMTGGPFRQAAKLSEAHITDIAPTLCYLLGLPVPAEMDGKVLLEAFQEAYVVSHPVQHQHGMWPVLSNNDAGPGITPEDEAKIRERLQGLGYIE